MNSKSANRKLTKKQLEHFRVKLLLEKNKVLEEMTDLQQDNLKQSISEASGENSRYTYHLGDVASLDLKSTRLNSSHIEPSRMPSSA